MAISQRTCGAHPERLAIGVCVVTGKAICAECSTRYEGVNYSKDGLRILQERRAAESRRHAQGAGGWVAAAIVTAPLFLYLLYLSYVIGLEFLVDFHQYALK